MSHVCVQGQTNASVIFRTITQSNKNQGNVAISVFSHKVALWIRITDHELEQSKYRQKHLFSPLIPRLFRLHSVEMHLMHFLNLKLYQSRESHGKRKGNWWWAGSFFSANHRADALLLNVTLPNHRRGCLGLLTYMWPEDRRLTPRMRETPAGNRSSHRWTRPSTSFYFHLLVFPGKNAFLFLVSLSHSLFLFRSNFSLNGAPHA